MANIKYQKGPVTVSIGQSSTVELPPRVARVRLTGFLFESDKSFVLPIVMHGIRGLVDYYQENPGLSVVVTGHTDTVGDAEYNRALSDERAQRIAEYLQDRVDPWLACYQGSPHSQRWGTREDQHMLSALDDRDGDRFYRGPVHGQLDAPTVDAVKRFQRSRGLADDGQPGPDTRRALVTAYMQLDGTTLPASAELAQLGCGENHNEVESGDGVDEPKNRRVEIFLFDPGPPDPEVPSRCPGGGCAYLEWKSKNVETIDFDHDLCELLVECVRDDESEAPVADATVELSRDGSYQKSGITGDDGSVWFRNLVPGKYHLRAEKEDYLSVERDVQVRPGGIAASEDASGGSTFAVTDKNDDSGANHGTSAPTGTPKTTMKMPSDAPFKIRLVEPGVTDDARLRPEDWKDAKIRLVFSDGSSVEADIPSEAQVKTKSQADTLHVEWVRTAGEHHTPNFWHVDKKEEIQRGVETDVPISSRLRVSVFDFGAPFWTGTGVDDTMAQKLIDSGIDDLSLVNTVLLDESTVFDFDQKHGKYTFVDRSPGLRWATKTDFIASSNTWFSPTPWGPLATQHANCEKYSRAIVQSLRGGGMQVLAGFCLGNSSESPFFVEWLEKASDDNIRKLAGQINIFLTSIGFNGIGFDLEITQLGEPHRRGMELLLTEMARLTTAWNGWVSYANAPFDVDGSTIGGVDSMSEMVIQPYNLAHGIPNLVSRPQCYGTLSDGPDTIVKGIQCALRKAWDHGGGNIRPSQLQPAIHISSLDTLCATGEDHDNNKKPPAHVELTNADRAALTNLGIPLNQKVMDDICTKLLRPNNAGITIYNLGIGITQSTPRDQVNSIVSGNIERCKHLNDVLNGPNRPRGSGHPLQVPMP